MKIRVIHIYFEGGAVSQLLALGTGIYFKNLQNMNFTLNYRNLILVHTKGFKLAKFLLPDETYKTFTPLKKEIKMNRFWSKIPSRFIPYFKWIRLLYQHARSLFFSFNASFQKKDPTVLRNKISNDRRLLNNLNPNISTIHGPFWPGLVGSVWPELDSRFKLAKITSPFERIENLQERIVVHYRLGDMRTVPYWANSHGVITPKFFVEIVDLVNRKFLLKLPVHVYSDEPEIARRLLKSIGIFDWKIHSNSLIWNDISEMKNCVAFIGSFSTVSSLVCEIRKIQKLKNNYLPINSRRFKIGRLEKLDKVPYLRAHYLPESHWIYQI